MHTLCEANTSSNNVICSHRKKKRETNWTRWKKRKRRNNCRCQTFGSRNHYLVFRMRAPMARSAYIGALDVSGRSSRRNRSGTMRNAIFGDSYPRLAPVDSSESLAQRFVNGYHGPNDKRRCDGLGFSIWPRAERATHRRYPIFNRAQKTLLAPLRPCLQEPTREKRCKRGARGGWQMQFWIGL